MVRGYLVNEFGEKVGAYNINGVNEYGVTLYHTFVGFMTERQIIKYADKLSLYLQEQNKIYTNVYGVK